MKKILILFVLSCLSISCSKDDDDDLQTPSTDFEINPPEWLQGSWEFEEEDQSGMEIKIFTDDVKMFSFGGAVVHDILGNPRSAVSKDNHTASVKEIFPSDDEYSIDVKIFDGNTQTQNMVYTFVRLESRTAKFTLNNYAVIIKKIQLVEIIRS